MAWQTQPNAVAESFWRLRERNIHPNFAGYLCLKRTAARDGTVTGLRPNFKEFFETFLRVPGGPEDRPYLKPFPSDAKLWFNENVAGSFAPRSLRPASPLRQIIDIDEDRRYSLVDGHWELARALLASDNRIPALPLAVFLYRDYALLGDDPPADIVRVFKEEFGYTDSLESGEEEYQHLYHEDGDVAASTDWFEEI